MTDDSNLTVEEYGIWLLRYIDSLPDGDHRYEMQEALEGFREEILYLECCHDVDSTPANKARN
ncbi:hypothetical protein SynBIOSU31_02086 [Synechococcus sp. BIOS-U3-1]|uniref:hypothetical protein n=1 Tax=Synechococcus sp. BIOS-U3-1 TaxID=1400865 RepID=UPI001647DBE8|nr:hypothetical protein [Synechococcus sp. BIOS-U3-1]QNI58952.1 hypothetical protein SynBIOSU31_02086 [Synechococcus sp. BIOS-U3-1]